MEKGKKNAYLSFQVKIIITSIGVMRSAVGRRQSGNKASIWLCAVSVADSSAPGTVSAKAQHGPARGRVVGRQSPANTADQH